MQEQFRDRSLTCVDCHAEFIFTAGEQLFFSDKQFKNDPKRCKPCKSRRSGLAAAANGAGPLSAGISRTETRTLCSDCGVETTVPFKPTQGRPVLCRQCFQLKNRAAAAIQPAVPSPAQNIAAAQIIVAAPDEPAGSIPSMDEVLSVASTLNAGPPPSSVPTPADLAYVAHLDHRLESLVASGVPASAQATARLTAQLIAGSPAELHAPAGPTPDLQVLAAESPQA